MVKRLTRTLEYCFFIIQILMMQVTVIQLWMRKMDQVQDQRDLTDGRELEILGLP